MRIEMKRLWTVIGAAAAIAPTHTIAAEARAYLTPESAAARLADGAPWSAHSPNGRTFKLTLGKDGAGHVNGPLNFRLSVNWTIKGDTVCLSGTMMSKCLRFEEIPGGLQGWNGEQPDLKLTR